MSLIDRDVAKHSKVLVELYAAILADQKWPSAF